MAKESRSEYTANTMLALAPVRQGWTVGKNFSKPLAKRTEQKSFLQRLLTKAK